MSLASTIDSSFTYLTTYAFDCNYVFLLTDGTLLGGCILCVATAAGSISGVKSQTTAGRSPLL